MPEPRKPQANIVQTPFGPRHIGHLPKPERKQAMQKMKGKYKTEMAAAKAKRKAGK